MFPVFLTIGFTEELRLSINQKQRMSMKQTAWDSLLRIRNPKRVDEMFDLVCAGNYFAGQFNGQIPVEESRKVFEHIKKLLSKQQ